MEGFRQKSVTDDWRTAVCDRDDAIDHCEQEKSDREIRERLRAECVNAESLGLLD